MPLTRVAFVDQSGDETGGAQESLALLLGHIPSSIEPHVVLFSDGRYAERVRSMGLDVHIAYGSKALSGATREGLSAGSAVAALSTSARVSKILGELKPDVVHTNSVKAHLIGGIASRIHAIPTVPHFRDELDGSARALVQQVARSVSRQRIAISRMVANSYALQNTTVVENPVDLESYANKPSRADSRRVLNLPLNGNIALLIGRINRWKGHDKFLRAAASISDLPDAHFVIAGAPRFRDADFLPELRAMVESLDLKNRVTFVDWIEDPRLLFAAADLNVNCSTREPFGRTVIEAAAAGVPTVCFDDAGVAEFMTDGIDGFLVPAGNEVLLSLSIERFLRLSPEEKISIGQRARLWAERFAVKRHADRVSAILMEAAHQRR